VKCRQCIKVENDTLNAVQPPSTREFLQEMT